MPLFFKGRGLNIVIFVISLICLVIDLRLFVSVFSYVDNYGTTPSLVYGGQFGLYMAWLRLVFLLVLPVLSGLNLIRKRE